MDFQSLLSKVQEKLKSSQEYYKSQENLKKAQDKLEGEQQARKILEKSLETNWTRRHGAYLFMYFPNNTECNRECNKILRDNGLEFILDCDYGYCDRPILTTKDS